MAVVKEIVIWLKRRNKITMIKAINRQKIIHLINNQTLTMRMLTITIQKHPTITVE